MVTIYKPDVDFDNNPYLENELIKISSIINAISRPMPWKLKNTSNTNIKILPNALTVGTLVSATLPSGTVFLHPFITTDYFNVSELGIMVNGAVSGSVLVGIYNTKNDLPYQLMGSVTLLTSTTGYKSGTTNIKLKEKETYWTAIASNISPTINFISAGNLPSLIGISATSNQMITGYTASGTTLPQSITISGVTVNNAPAVYIR